MGKRAKRKRKRASKSDAIALLEKVLQQKSREEALAQKKDSELFVLDDGNKAQQSRRELKQALVLERKLKTEDKRRRLMAGQRVAHKELLKQKRKAAASGRSVQDHLVSKQKHKANRIAQRKVQETQLYDLWGDDKAIADPTTRKTLEVLSEPKGNETNEWVKYSLKHKNIDKHWRQDRARNRKEHQNNKFGVRAAEVVGPGGSYNPDETQRRQLLQQVAQQELAAQEFRLGKDKQTLIAEAEAEEQQTIEDKQNAKQLENKKATKALTDAQAEKDEAEEDNSDAEDDDWLSKENKFHKNKEEMTRAQRNRARRHRERMLQLEQKKKQKLVRLFVGVWATVCGVSFTLCFFCPRPPSRSHSMFGRLRDYLSGYAQFDHELRKTKTLAKEVAKQEEEVGGFVWLLFF